MRIPTWALYAALGAAGVYWMYTRSRSAAAATLSPGVKVDPTKTPVATGDGALSAYSAGASVKAATEKLGPGGTAPTSKDSQAAQAGWLLGDTAAWTGLW